MTVVKDPRRYFEAVQTRATQATAPPVCLYLEVTNRCNLLCETCPRTFETLEPPADMSWDLFTSIVDQVPDVARVVLHGVGEPMLVKALPRMIRYLKDRGVYVLFNTNGTLLSPKKYQAMIDSFVTRLSILTSIAPTSIPGWTSCACRSMRRMRRRFWQCGARISSSASCAMCVVSPSSSAGPVPCRRGCRCG